MKQSSSRQIFISYSRKDGDFCLRLAKDLKAAGIHVWIDQLDIPAGVRWDQAVHIALESAETILIILSPDAVNSENVLDEIGYSIDNRKLIFPVLHRKCEVPLRLRRIQYVDFSDAYEPALKRLIHQLKVSGADAASGEHLESLHVVSKLRRGSRPRLMLAAVVLVITAAIGVFAIWQFDAWRPVPEKPDHKQTKRSLGGPPQVAIDACTGMHLEQACQFEGPRRKLNGICRDGPSGVVACLPNDASEHGTDNVPGYAEFASVRLPRVDGERAPPPEAYAACEDLSKGSACSVATHDGTLSGTCRVPPNRGSPQGASLICVPSFD